MPHQRPSDDDIDAVYQRFIAGEPDAPSDLIELILDPLIDALHRRYPSLPDNTWIEDVVADSVLRMVQGVSGYIPERGMLWSYLFNDAYRDLLNLVEKEKRRSRHFIVLDSVAFEALRGNTNIEAEIIDRLAPTDFSEHGDIKVLWEQLRQEITDPHDWLVINLMYSKERRTEVFAETLGILHLPVDEQRKRVKQVKDRLRLRLRRLGVKLNDQ
ncbi:MAG: hypothetical protein H0T53_01365 [Herpetosiphonaceae bacterium]|nr:hypothetical protein [Herpetosiphonaceae bacterium]